MRYVALITVLLFCIVGLQAQNLSATERATALYNNGEYPTAIEIYNGLIEEAPYNKELLYNRGLCYLKTNETTNALADFDAAIAIDSLFKEARYAKAVTLNIKGNKEASIAEFKMLHAIDANYDAVAKRIKNYELAVYLSRNWYYMVAMAVLLIIFLALIVTYQTSKKGF